MNDKQKTFLILTPGFAASEDDSTCLPMQQQFVLSLQKMYPNIRFLILALQYPYFKKSYKWFDINVHSFNGKNKAGITRLMVRKAVNRIMHKIHNETEIAGILSFWLGECAYVGKRFATKNKLDHKCWLLGQDVKAGNPYFDKIKPGPHELIALSDFLKDEIKKNYGVVPATVIHAGFDISKIANRYRKRDICIVAAGSLIPLKRFELLVEVAALLRIDHPDLKVVLIGTGPEQKKMARLIRENNLADSFTLTGELDHASVLEYFQRSKLFVHPSSYEGFSGVCLEALAAGCRVISFCQPMNETIPGWEVVGSIAEMTTKCNSYLHSTPSQHSIPTKFEMDTVARNMVSLWSDA